MNKNRNQYMNYILIVAMGFLSNACYTIIDAPFEEQTISNSEFDSSTNDISSDSGEGYTIINNYTCSHNSGCCGHDHCHSYSHHHGYSCAGYCQITFNWWTGTYHWDYYGHHHHQDHYGHGYYNGYHDGYYDGYWWGYNNWESDDEYDDNYYSDNTQDRRDRSFTRENLDIFPGQTSNNNVNKEESNLISTDPVLSSVDNSKSTDSSRKREKVNSQKVGKSNKNNDSIGSNTRKPRSFQYGTPTGSQKISGGKKKSNKTFSNSSNSIINLINIISSVSSSKKSKKKSNVMAYNSKKSNKSSKKKSNFKSKKK